MDSSRKAPTLADLEALPAGVKGEIIDGVMYTMTRPPGPHQRIERVVVSRIGDPFDDGRDGPGGWWILPEPGIELPNTPESCRPTRPFELYRIGSARFCRPRRAATIC